MQETSVALPERLLLGSPVVEERHVLCSWNGQQLETRCSTSRLLQQEDASSRSNRQEVSQSPSVSDASPSSSTLSTTKKSKEKARRINQAERFRALELACQAEGADYAELGYNQLGKNNGKKFKHPKEAILEMATRIIERGTEERRSMRVVAADNAAPFIQIQTMFWQLAIRYPKHEAVIRTSRLVLKLSEELQHMLRSTPKDFDTAQTTQKIVVLQNRVEELSKKLSKEGREQVHS